VKKAGLDFSVVNVVATTKVGQPINLNALNTRKNFFYDPDVYRCGYIKDQKMKGKVSIFPSGKLISIGTKKESDAINDLKHVAKLLERANHIKHTNVGVKIQNIVAIADLDKTIDLTRLATNVVSAVYEPEQFPGAIIKLDELSNVTVLVFGSGKLVLLGLKNLKHLKQLSKHIIEIVGPYQR